jgi:hypothetical protein
MKDEFEGTSLQAPRCYESHPALKIGNGILCGGSSSWPVVRDADIYVALQSGSSSDLASDPWLTAPKVVEVHFGVRDQHAPDNIKRFKKMIDWLCNQLQEGKKIHVGCIGGHGRTGTVLSAIVAQALGEKNAIQYVRKNYCTRAVESSEQIHFLMKEYGVSKVEGSKHHLEIRSDSLGVVPIINGKRQKTTFGGAPVGSYGRNAFSSAGGYSTGQTSPSPVLSADRKAKQIVPEGYTKDTKSFNPLASERCIWRSRR